MMRIAVLGFLASLLIAEPVDGEVSQATDGVTIAPLVGREVLMARENDPARVGRDAAAGALDEFGQGHRAHANGVDAFECHDPAQRGPAVLAHVRGPS